jgi:hypothetical protein
MEYNIRAGSPEEDSFFAHCFYSMWMDIGVDTANILADWHANTLSFLSEVRKRDSFQWFGAEVVGKPGFVGVAGGHIYNPYPEVFTRQFRLSGLIW